MIFYDSHRWRSLLKFRGSVLPRAMLYALPAAIAAYLLKYLEQEGFVNLERISVLTQGDIYSGFTYVLGFSLVFRTSQSYSRYWEAATQVHEMAAVWSDACSSLVCFTNISQAPLRDIIRFKHTVVRLFSLLHAMALWEITCVEGELPVLDVQGLGKMQLQLLTSEGANNRKVQITLSWIKSYITQCASEGLLNVSPPILQRVFQELGAGAVNFHKAQQVVIWPFPFPYTQLTVVLINVYTVITPLVVSTWDTWPGLCAFCTFISVTSFMGLDQIAAELEQPFGDDPNDLPVEELQVEMNRFLVMQLHPGLTHPPELMPNALMSLRALHNQAASASGGGMLAGLKAGAGGMRRIGSAISAATLHSRSGSAIIGRSTAAPASPATPATGSNNTKSFVRRKDRLNQQKRWLGEQPSVEQAAKLQHMLKCPGGVGIAEIKDTGPCVQGAALLSFEESDAGHSRSCTPPLHRNSLHQSSLSSDGEFKQQVLNLHHLTSTDTGGRDIRPHRSSRTSVTFEKALPSPCASPQMSGEVFLGHSFPRSVSEDQAVPADLMHFLQQFQSTLKEHLDSHLVLHKQEMSELAATLRDSQRDFVRTTSMHAVWGSQEQHEEEEAQGGESPDVGLEDEAPLAPSSPASLVPALMEVRRGAPLLSA